MGISPGASPESLPVKLGKVTDARRGAIGRWAMRGFNKEF